MRWCGHPEEQILGNRSRHFHRLLFGLDLTTLNRPIFDVTNGIHHGTICMLGILSESVAYHQFSYSLDIFNLSSISEVNLWEI